MSMENTPLHCSSCDYIGALVHRPVTLVYQLPSGEELKTGRNFCWCNTCGGVRDAEPDFSIYFGVDGRIAELKKVTGTLSARAHNVIDRLLGGSPVSPDESELRELVLGQKIARARSSSPRCLDCGETNIQSLDEYIHSCGGRLIRGTPSDDGPRFHYASETIYLDYEGRKVLSSMDPYIQFAQTAEIECVMKDGLVALVYVTILFDERDFAPLLADKEKFRKFAKIIELRIMHDDFENPLMSFVEPPSQRQVASIAEATRALIVGNEKVISKWLRNQVMSR